MPGDSRAVARRLSPEGPASRLVDLGSGGGLPGLVVATEWPGSSNGAPGGERAADRLPAPGRGAPGPRGAGLGARGASRAERPRAWILRAFDGALARSFGRPAVVAECAAPLLKVGGWLLVSEPPRSDEDEASGRTVAGGTPRQLGLEADEVVHEEFEYRVLRQARCAPSAFPDATGSRPRIPSFDEVLVDPGFGLRLRAEPGSLGRPGLHPTLQRRSDRIRGQSPGRRSRCHAEDVPRGTAG